VKVRIEFFSAEKVKLLIKDGNEDPSDVIKDQNSRRGNKSVRQAGRGGGVKRPRTGQVDGIDSGTHGAMCALARDRLFTLGFSGFVKM
jgi:hypothetical protein